MTKKKTKGESKGVGRPSAEIERYLTKIKEPLKTGMSLHKACIARGVPLQTVRDHMEKNPVIREKIETWKMDCELLARDSVRKGIKDDPTLALKFMSLKFSDEFNSKQNVVSKTELTGDLTFVAPFKTMTDGRELPEHQDAKDGTDC